MRSKSNLLGDLRAEADLEMLNQAFLETTDYRALIETTDRPIVVGRRGTGKSALLYRLSRHWHSTDRTLVIQIVPSEDQMIGLRELARHLFSDSYTLLRAGSKIAWKYAISMEVAEQLAKQYRFQKATQAAFLEEKVRHWRSLGPDPTFRLRRALTLAGTYVDASARLAEIAAALSLNRLQQSVAECLLELGLQAVVLIDRVDEGYEPDHTGVALIDGMVLAAIDTNTRFEQARTTLFLRDNMARALEQLDPDFSRDIEGQILRLHWEESQLLTLVCNRLRTVFALNVENDVKVWNQCTGKGLQGRDGFRTCLRLTLYRPRDILALLNQAYLRAARDKRTQIIDEDIDATANEISRYRLEDLKKEYEAALPGLSHYVSSFNGGSPSNTVTEVFSRFEEFGPSIASEPAALQTFEILNSAPDVAGVLYSVGFLGVKDPATGSLLFCHDGRPLDRILLPTDRLMVHPCYWRALGLTEQAFDPSMADDIFDDYDIRVVSETPELRRVQLGKIIGEVARIDLGQEGSAQFGDWCLRAIKIGWPTQLHNIELHKSQQDLRLKEVIATNLAEKGAWRRIAEEFNTRTVLFEIWNRIDLTHDDYRKLAHRLTGKHGNLGFLVCRGNKEDLTADGDLTIVRQLWKEHGRLVIKLTDGFFSRILSKLRTPKRHDEPDQQIGKLVDRYKKLYIPELARKDKT